MFIDDELMAHISKVKAHTDEVSDGLFAMIREIEELVIARKATYKDIKALDTLLELTSTYRGLADFGDELNELLNEDEED